ncbi:7808_t:CDS:2 [Racocetra persica]|uniref:7808_t:CDS:1 n=1 Tax=Racocetra persica TaxID=160502 RepID=A0ACA9KDQ8_9GLOM|nr:7808_t:CDS:2 [Racocetra persica]
MRDYKSEALSTSIAKKKKLIDMIKKFNTKKLIKFLLEEIQLDKDDLDTIYEKKVSDHAFIKLTKDKLKK